MNFDSYRIEFIVFFCFYVHLLILDSCEDFSVSSQFVVHCVRFLTVYFHCFWKGSRLYNLIPFYQKLHSGTSGIA